MIAGAGVRVAITTDHPVVPIEHLRLQAILAVDEGLPAETALAALTANPAAMLRLEERVGALEPGRDGDVVLWSGDPLATGSRVLRAYIQGREVLTPAESGTRVVERGERFAR